MKTTSVCYMNRSDGRRRWDKNTSKSMDYGPNKKLLRKTSCCLYANVHDSVRRLRVNLKLRSLTSVGSTNSRPTLTSSDSFSCSMTLKAWLVRSITSVNTYTSTKLARNCSKLPQTVWQSIKTNTASILIENSKGNASRRMGRTNWSVDKWSGHSRLSSYRRWRSKRNRQ